MNYDKFTLIIDQIKYINNECEKIKPLVAINCITYNHEHYLKSTLESFVKQKTTFPFVVIVHDDASTDNTPNIIQQYVNKYPTIIFPIFEKENQHSKNNGSLAHIMSLAIELTGAKYEAMCEGDDYWIDPYKLQKQVDFLEAHPDYGMCYSKMKQFVESASKFGYTCGGSAVTLQELLKENTIPTLTVMVRRSVVCNYLNDIQPEKYKWLMGDYPRWLYVAGRSKIMFMDEVTSVYRILKNSRSHSTNYIRHLEFLRSSYMISNFFAKYYNTQWNNELQFRSQIVAIQIAALSQNIELKKIRKVLFSLLKNPPLNPKICIIGLMLYLMPRFVSKKLQNRFLKSIDHK